MRLVRNARRVRAAGLAVLGRRARRPAWNCPGLRFSRWRFPSLRFPGLLFQRPLPRRILLPPRPRAKPLLVPQRRPGASRRLKILPRAAPRRRARRPRKNRRLNPDKRLRRLRPGPRAKPRNRVQPSGIPAPIARKKKPASAPAAKAAPPGAHPGQKSTPNAQPEKSCGAEWRRQ